MLKKKKQQSIENFFGGRRPVALSPAALERTPERTNSARDLGNRLTAPSFLLGSQSQSGFDEPSSADISIESPEINNFRSQSLRLVYNTQLEIIDLTSLPTRAGSGAVIAGIKASNKEDKENLVVKESKKRSFLEVLVPPKRKLQRSTSSFEGASSRLLGRANTPPESNFSSSDNVDLSEEQKRVLRLVVDEGRSVFYTGSAGTGKSVVLRELVARLRRKHSPLEVGVTAATGLAACNIGGQTLHRFLGIGRGEGTADAMAARIEKNRDALRRWKGVKVLVIDEVSMVDGELFEKLCSVGSKLRKSPRPFGGIQVVCTGDFFQLPPVSKGLAPVFCFTSKAWQKTMQNTVLLQEVFRQKGDPQLIGMLNAVRCGDIGPAELAQFARLSRRVTYEDGIEPTELFPTRREVKAANEMRLRTLPGRATTFKAADDAPDQYMSELLDNLVCEKELELRTGAQVMYLRNLDDEIVNGSMGTVMCFLTARTWERAVAIYGDIHDVHNMRSITLAADLIALGGLPGSEVVNEAKATIPPSKRSKFEEFFSAVAADLSSEKYPVVKFSLVGGGYRTLLIQREDFTVELPGRGGAPIKITRSQIPLVLSWALLIHKAQGQTIPRLRVNLSKVFESGQVYVALSRVTHTSTLEVVNFNLKLIRVSPIVKEFYRTLEVMKTPT